MDSIIYGLRPLSRHYTDCIRRQHRSTAKFITIKRQSRQEIRQARVKYTLRVEKRCN